MQSPVPPTEELILERLLAGLLERGGGPEMDGVNAPPDLVALRDMARRLRASVQWMPLPRSRLALRRALLATVEAAPGRPAGPSRERYRPAAWRRTGRWLTAVTAATFLMIGAALGAHALEMAFGPSGSLYTLALQMDAMRVQLAGDAVHRAATLVEVTRARAAEIGESAYGDDPRGVEEAAAALERQNNWLRSVASSLPPAAQQRLAPAEAKSEALVVAARRAAQLRMSGLLPSGVTMSNLLSAASGPLSGASTTDISTSPEPSREGSRGAASSGAPSARETGWGSTTRTESSSGGGASGGSSGADAGTAGAAGGGASASDSTGRGGASGGTASPESHKNRGGGDAAPGSGSGSSASSGGHGGDQGGAQGGSAQSGSSAGAGGGQQSGGPQGGHGNNGGHNGSSRSDGSRDDQGSGGGQGNGGTGDNGSHNR